MGFCIGVCKGIAGLSREFHTGLYVGLGKTGLRQVQGVTQWPGTARRSAPPCGISNLWVFQRTFA